MPAMRIASPLSLLVFAASVSAADLPGEYAVDGRNPDGKPYKGVLTVEPRGDAWRFEWRAGTESSGIGVDIASKIAVAVGGDQCAIVLYRVQPDGSLQGVWTSPLGGAVGSETATRTAGTSLAGDYAVEGKNQNGSPYTGTLRIAQEGEHWRLSWTVGGPYEGYGIERDGYLGVSWGAATCGVVLYQRVADGLDGDWKYYQTGVGQERAVRTALEKPTP